MGRMYTVQFNGVAVTAQQDFLELIAPTDAVVILHDWELSQSTEMGDAAEEMLNIYVKRGAGTVTTGAGGSTPTPSPIEFGDVAFGGTTKVNNTTKMAAGTGSIQTLSAHAWNERVPFQKIYTPETRPIISPGNRLTIELGTTPADSVTINFTATFEEVGG